MITCDQFLFFVLLFGMMMVGVLIGYLTSTDYKRALDRDYKRKRAEMEDKIREETKNEWSSGWDDAFKVFGNRQKAYYLWFSAHGYNTTEVENWAKKYLADEIKGDFKNE